MTLPAQQLMDGGYRLVPVRGKAPIWKGWVNRWADNPAVFTTGGVTGIGVLLGQGDDPIIAVDCDCDDEQASRAFYDALCNYANSGVKLPVRIGKWPHWTVPLRAAVVPPRLASARWIFKESIALGRVEIGTHGQQFVAYGTHPDSGRPYSWQHGELFDLAPMDFPQLQSVDEIIGLLALFDDIARRRGAQQIDEPKGTQKNTLVPLNALEREAPLDGVDLEDAKRHLAMLDTYDDYEAWLRVGMALHHQFDGGGAAYTLWNDWSKQSSKYQGATDTAARWRSFAASRAKPITYASILHELKPEPADLPETDAYVMPSIARTTDASLTDALVPLLKDNYRYDAEFNKWRHYTEGRWIVVPMVDVFGAVRELLTGIVENMDVTSKEAIKIMRQLDSASQVNAIITELQSRGAMRCNAYDFDSLRTAGLIHFTNGIYDVATGELKPFAPTRYMGDLSAGCAYNAVAECPVFKHTVADALYDDQDYIDYLQRVLGYATLGNPVEQLMFIALGGGANGKTTIFEAVRYAMGEYATIGRSSTLMAASESTGGAPREDILRLAGKRFVLTEELDDRGVLNEALVKQLTGGAEFVARGMFETKSSMFKPTWVSVLTANWAPTIRGTDVGIWRRIQVLPFTRNLLTDPSITVDKHLPSKLRHESQGILRWLLQGARAYGERGLGEVPSVVDKATREYRGKMDLISQWANACLTFGPDEHAADLELFVSWSAWANARGSLYVAANANKLIEIMRLHYPDLPHVHGGLVRGVGIQR